jgi:hypothetical protein
LDASDQTDGNEQAIVDTGAATGSAYLLIVTVSITTNYSNYFDLTYLTSTPEHAQTINEQSNGGPYCAAKIPDFIVKTVFVVDAGSVVDSYAVSLSNSPASDIKCIRAKMICFVLFLFFTFPFEI